MDAPTQIRHGADSVEPSIREAQERYLLSGPSSIHQGFRNVIKALVKNGFTKPIPNDSYADALFLTDIMLEHTDRNFRMLTGPGGDGFISTLRPNFEKMLDRLSSRGGNARIILLRLEHDSAVNLPCLDELKKLFSTSFDFATGKSEQAQRHFIVSDSQMLRIEEEHPPLKPSSPANTIKAQVYIDAPLRARILEENFDRVWNILRPEK